MKKKANQPKSKNTDQTTAKPAAQINDLPPTDEQAEQAKGGVQKLSSIWGGSGSEAYQSVQQRWD